ncbi:MAG: threonine--tRNA ligase, partial [Solobacterium sp.]|nr:threonine--tRNA ligase [Solobacterium sp.]
PEQLKAECQRVLDLIISVYNDFNIKDYRFRLSLRDINNKEKYFGNDELWEMSESALRDVLQERHVDFYEAPGEAAFYGPKIDVQIRSAVGHDVTMSTVQVDYQLPRRFELTYIDENGEKQTPIVVHRAILGSLDRFFALLLEETKGILPLWLAPTQIVVIPVSPDAHREYADKVIAELKKHKIRVRMDDRNEKLGYRVREAQTQKIPVEVVVGDGEANENSVTVRRYGSKEETKMSLDDFVKAMLDEIDRKGK